MKQGMVEDRIVAKHIHETFVQVLQEMGVTVTFKQVRQHGSDAVELTGCELSFDSQSYFMERKERVTFDEEAHWKHILKTCTDLGFVPKMPTS